MLRKLNNWSCFRQYFFLFVTFLLKEEGIKKFLIWQICSLLMPKCIFLHFLIILFALKLRILDTYGTNYKSLLKKYCVQVENYAIEIALIRTSVMTHYITRIYAIFKAWFSNWTQLRTLRSKAWKSRYLKKRVKLQKNPTQFP